MFGVGYTDLHVRLPMTRVLMVLVFTLAAALIYNAARRRHVLVAGRQDDRLRRGRTEVVDAVRTVRRQC